MLGLEKIPDDRYASARDLMNDLDRWLGGETVSAGRSSRITMARKWCLRNRGFTAAFILISSVLVFASIQWRQAIFENKRAERHLAMTQKLNERADRHLAMAQEIIVEMVTKTVSDADLPADLRRSFSQRAVDLQLQLLREEPNDPNVVFQTAYAYNQFSTILYDLSEFDQSLLAVTEALRIVEPFSERIKIDDLKQRLVHRKAAVLRALQRYEEAAQVIDDTNQMESLSDLNKARTFFQRGMGNVSGRRDPESAKADFKKAAAIYNELEKPGHVKREIGQNLFFLGLAEMYLGNLEEAQVPIENALEMFEELFEAVHLSRSSEAIVEDMGRCYLSLGQISHAKLKEIGLPANAKSTIATEARQQFEKAAELFREVFNINPGRNGAYGMLVMALELHIQLEIERRSATQAKSVLEQLDALFPIVPTELRERQIVGKIVAKAHLSLAKLQIELGETDKASEQLVQGIEFLDRLVIEFPGVKALEDLHTQCRSLLSKISETERLKPSQ